MGVGDLAFQPQAAVMNPLSEHPANLVTLQLTHVTPLLTTVFEI